MTARRAEELTDEQWALLQPLIPEPPRREDGRGQPWRATREVLNGVLCVMRTGAAWADIPERFPPYQTCHRQFQAWVKSGVFQQVLETLAEDLKQRGDLDLSECFIDGTFVVAKKGGLGVGKTKRGKGTKLMAVADRTGLPLAVYVTSASPHEITLVAQTLETGFLSEAPQRLIADRVYDSDPLDSRLRQQGIELIAPHKANRIWPNTQDGRPLRRYLSPSLENRAVVRLVAEFQTSGHALRIPFGQFSRFRSTRLYSYFQPSLFMR